MLPWLIDSAKWWSCQERRDEAGGDEGTGGASGGATAGARHTALAPPGARVFFGSPHPVSSHPDTEPEDVSKDVALSFPVLSVGSLLYSQLALFEIPCTFLACLFL